MAINFKDKTAIISGAASGIGLALSRELGTLGMHIVMADIDSKALDAEVSRLKAESLSVTSCKLDVSEFSQWEEVVKKAKSEFGGLHMVINNAGVGGIPGKIEETNHDTWRWIVDVNLMGVLHGTQACVPAIKETGQGGWVINVASMAGMGGVPYATAYCATKAAVVSMSESWAQELKNDGIWVSVLCPAFVKTRIHESLRTMQSKYKSDKPLASDASLKKGFNAAAALVESGISSELLAKRVVEALNNRQTYIFTHPNYRESVQARSHMLDKAFIDAETSPLVSHLKDDEILSL